MARSAHETLPAPPTPRGGWLARLREPGWALSGIAHGALLVGALVAFSRTPPLPDANEAIPVEVVDANALRSVTQGEKTAQTVVENPRPRIDRVAETNETSPRPGEAKRDVPTPPARAPEPSAQPAPEAAAAPTPPQPQATAEAAPPPPPEPAAEAPPLPPRRPTVEPPTPPVPEPPRREQAAVTPARPVPTPPAREEAEEAAAPPRRVEPPKPEPPKPEPPKPEVARPQPPKPELARPEPPRPERRPEPPRPDPAEIARLLQRTAPSPKPTPAPTPAPAPKPTPAPPTTAATPAARAPARERGDTAFNPNDIARLLQSRETPQAAASTGAAPQRTAALGSTSGRAAKLSLSDRDALLGTLREQLRNCWNPLPGSEGVVPRVRVQLAVDGTLTAQPAVVNSSSDPRFQAAADGALRAVRRCAPFRNLGRFAPFHDDWRTLVVDFNPAELL